MKYSYILIMLVLTMIGLLTQSPSCATIDEDNANHKKILAHLDREQELITQINTLLAQTKTVEVKAAINKYYQLYRNGNYQEKESAIEFFADIRAKEVLCRMGVIDYLGLIYMHAAEKALDLMQIGDLPAMFNLAYGLPIDKPFFWGSEGDPMGICDIITGKAAKMLHVQTPHLPEYNRATNKENVRQQWLTMLQDAKAKGTIAGYLDDAVQVVQKKAPEKAPAGGQEKQ